PCRGERIALGTRPPPGGGWHRTPPPTPARRRPTKGILQRQAKDAYRQEYPPGPRTDGQSRLSRAATAGQNTRQKGGGCRRDGLPRQHDVGQRHGCPRLRAGRGVDDPTPKKPKRKEPPLGE